MSVRNSPPKQRKRKSVVTSHDNQRSVGHNLHTRPRKTILDPQNGRGLRRNNGGSAPGANGPAVTRA